MTDVSNFVLMLAIRRPGREFLINEGSSQAPLPGLEVFVEEIPGRLSMGFRFEGLEVRANVPPGEPAIGLEALVRYLLRGWGGRGE
jgi:hypothetical protein